MAKQDFFVETMVELSDTLVDDFDVVDVLTMLSSRCAELLGVSATGILLSSVEGDLSYLTSSKHSLRELVLFQSDAIDGPSFEAYRGEKNISWQSEGAQLHWPKFSAEALEAGFHSGHCILMRLRDRTIGVMSIMRIESGHMDKDEFAMARGLADLAAITILTHEAASDATKVNNQLTTALNTRVIIEEAKGFIGNAKGCDMEVAFATIRQYSRNNNLRLSKVAAAIVDRSLSADNVPLWTNAGDTP